MENIIKIFHTQGRKIYINFSSKIEDFLASDEKELIIERCNGFMRRLVYQETKRRWPDKVKVESKVLNTWNCLLVQKVGTEEEEKEKENKKQEKEKLEFDQAVGLSNLLKKIISCVSIAIYTPKLNDYRDMSAKSLDDYIICSFSW